VSDSTPISKLLTILKVKGFVFVISEDNIRGIVTRADINKPVVRIYLFGNISLFELHLNYWIRMLYSRTVSRIIIVKIGLNIVKSRHYIPPQYYIFES
jgi:hypothetical protein